MDGLDDRAEAALESLVEQLYASEVVQVSHSSRDAVILRLASVLKNSAAAVTPPVPNDGGGQGEAAGDNSGGTARGGGGGVPAVVTRKLVFRSGLSVSGANALREALEENGRNLANLDELEFCSLPNVEALEGALRCAALDFPRIRRLTLIGLEPGRLRLRVDHGAIATAISSLLLAPNSTLESLVIIDYPLHSVGAGIIADAMSKNTTLRVLGLQNCGLQSDSAPDLARLIRNNRGLEELDLSHNRRLYLGSAITREMSVKTIVRRGLLHNTDLVELHMRALVGGGPSPVNRSKIDLHLDINRFRKLYVREGRSPFDIPPALWPYALARVAPKPAVLHMFLQESVAALFPFI